MILIGENIHIISNSVRQALIERNKDFIVKLIKMQSNMDYVDLNIGPAKNDLKGIMPWLVSLIDQESDLDICFDTTNIEEMRDGLSIFSGNSFINSTNNDEPKLSQMSDLAIEYGSNLIALTMGKTGIPKTSDGRLEIAFEMYEKFLEKGMNSEKIFFDPLILPICVDQTQGLEALNTIKMIKESFDPPVKTLIGLSNISNGAVERNLLNRVFAVLAYGAGLDAAIVDAKDFELLRIINMLKDNNPQSESDELLINLAKMVENLSDIEEVSYDKNSAEQMKIIKTAKILLNKEIYSHSFTQI